MGFSGSCTMHSKNMRRTTRRKERKCGREGEGGLHLRGGDKYILDIGKLRVTM